MENGFNHRFLRGPASWWPFAAKNGWVKGSALIIVAAYLISAAKVAIVAAYQNDEFPEALLVKVEALPILFPLHMVTGGLALLLVPLALMLRRTRYHKIAGRLAAVDVVIAGITAIPVALTSPVTPLAAAGFSMQGLVWLALIGKGIWHVKRREIRQHQNAMLMMAAVTSGALFFRVYLALWAIYGTPAGFKTFYGFDAWLAWALPLILTAYGVTRPFPFARRESAVPMK